MKPIMKPPPIITVGTENTITIMPQAFLFAGLMRSIKEPINIMALHTSPIAVKLANGTVSFDVPGIVGITQGNQVETAPKSAAFVNIKIPAIREKAKAFDFSLRLIFSHHFGFWVFRSKNYKNIMRCLSRHLLRLKVGEKYSIGHVSFRLRVTCVASFCLNTVANCP